MLVCVIESIKFIFLQIQSMTFNFVKKKYFLIVLFIHVKSLELHSKESDKIN